MATTDVGRDDPLVNAYYFRAHSYTLVPEQARADLAWMAERGTDAVSLAVLEQDLWAAVENYEFVIEVAHDLGMEVHAVPSRWGAWWRARRRCRASSPRGTPRRGCETRTASPTTRGCRGS